MTKPRAPKAENLIVSAYTIPPEIKRRIEEIAESEDRSASNVATRLLRLGLESYDRPKAKKR